VQLFQRAAFRADETFAEDIVFVSPDAHDLVMRVD